MAKMIQIRHVPDSLHRELKSRAAKRGMTLSDYLLMELKQIAETPTMEEMLARLRRRTRVNLPVSSAALIRAERDSR